MYKRDVTISTFLCKVIFVRVYFEKQKDGAHFKTSINFKILRLDVETVRLVDVVC